MALRKQQIVTLHRNPANDDGSVHFAYFGYANLRRIHTALAFILEHALYNYVVAIILCITSTVKPEILACH